MHITQDVVGGEPSTGCTQEDQGVHWSRPGGEGVDYLSLSPGGSDMHVVTWAEAVGDRRACSCIRLSLPAGAKVSRV